VSESDLESWRAEVREWLASVLPQRSGRPEGPADYAVFQNITEEAERELLDKVRAYRKQRFDAGYGAIALPAELGGAGLSMRYVIAFTEEEQAFEAPPSTAMYCPVTWREAGEARYTTAPMRSVSLPSRPRGVCAITPASICSSSPLDSFEGKNPGQMAFTRIP